VVGEVCDRGGTLIRLVDDEETDSVFALMGDPEGNEFCLV
jgi:predicted enzyme related to lactoylglutathione lyase